MMLRKLVLLLSVLTVSLSFAQNRKKKKVDTVYIYEKVVVYDTVYRFKPLPSRLKDLILPELKVEETKFVRNVYKEEIDRQRASRRAQLRRPATFLYGIEGGAGLKNTNWTTENSGNNNQFGEYLGFWASKSFFSSQFSVQLSANVYHWNSSFDLDANKEDTFFNGYYFTKDNQPLLFQRFNNKHFEYSVQLKFMYNWRNIRPFAGILVNRNTYKMQFLVPENNVLNRVDDFKSSQTNLGFALGIQYRILRRFLLSAEYQQYALKNFSLKNADFDFEIFKTNNTFAERKISFGISYILSKL
ncbi:hypothetical protein QE422_001597 [Chryseobacterium sp. SORGH_AS 447]|uniref:hypothetical protein n=1 Tax=Chryseobacterium sp. SORGH_AS_0447 TaxID=3041769 RepID=UPI00277F8479|nr:hypothetical protein [Chryseobacterium sp. SORGH_AS_0447]MDQ1161229.1 hypothetical protein [Chryseobacterium sp. SORGH_AS_0447]